VASIEPNELYRERSGLATSTRNTAIRLWGSQLPAGNATELASRLFACENPPGSQRVSGSQDALGIMLPGVTSLHYRGGYWPDEMASLFDEDLLAWLDARLSLLPLPPRDEAYNAMDGARVDACGAKRLAAAADAVWKAIWERNAQSLGSAVTAGLN